MADRKSSLGQKKSVFLLGFRLLLVQRPEVVRLGFAYLYHDTGFQVQWGKIQIRSFDKHDSFGKMGDYRNSLTNDNLLRHGDARMIISLSSGVL